MALVDQLERLGVYALHEEFELAPDRPPRDQIEKGLSVCPFGVAIVSPGFLACDWPQDALLALNRSDQLTGRRLIFPVWQNVAGEDVEQFSTALAACEAGDGRKGAIAVAAHVSAAFRDASAQAHRRRRELEERRPAYPQELHEVTCRHCGGDAYHRGGGVYSCGACGLTLGGDQAASA